MAECRRCPKRSEGFPEFARAILALEALEAVLAPPVQPTRSARGSDLDADAEVGTLQSVLVRMRPPAVLATLRDRAADGMDPAGLMTPPPPAATSWVDFLPNLPFMLLDYFRARQGWVTFMALILFPRVLVALGVRTFKSLFGQLSFEMGTFGKDTLTSLTSTVAEHADQIESVVLNTSTLCRR
jgi:hypothetical protein